jgi:hypothetical protein
MIDVKSVFTKNAGDRVTYLSHRFQGLRLFVRFVWDGGPETEMSYELLNGSDKELAYKAAVLGNRAASHVYHRSGQYDKDFKEMKAKAGF